MSDNGALKKAKPRFRFRDFVRTYIHVFRFTWQASRNYFVLALILLVAGAAVGPAWIWMSKETIDHIHAALSAKGGGEKLDWLPLLAPVALAFGIWALAGLSQPFANVVNGLFSQRVSMHAEQELYRKACSLDLAFFEKPDYYDRLDKARHSMHRVSSAAWGFLGVSRALLSLFAVLALLIQFHWWAALLLMAACLPQVIAQAYYTNKRYGWHTLRTPTRRMRGYLSNLLSAREPAKEIRLLGLSPMFLERFHRAAEEMFEERRKLSWSEELADVALGLLPLAATATLWTMAISETAGGSLSLGMMTLVFQASEHARRDLSWLFNEVGYLYEHQLFLKDFIGFLALPPDEAPGALVRVREKLPFPAAMRQGIEFRGVSFRYPGSEKDVLRQLHFHLSPGQIVAVVGANGSGKTTLIKLLTRCYDPTEGAILLDGRDYREYRLEDLHRNLGVIFQDFMKYDLTARENVGLGDWTRREEDRHILQALAQADSREVVAKLPKGLETYLGKTFEDACDLSGGEWQKLALARACFRRCQVLILDEPTASLDALAEYQVFKRFAELAQGKLTVLISHRFSTVRMASRILVLEEGELREEGDHDSLMAREALYARMFRTQAEAYAL